MSALPSKADVAKTTPHVRFVPKADIAVIRSVELIVQPDTHELICRGVFWQYFVVSFLPLGSHPAMLFDPVLGFSLRVEIAKVARRAARPLHLDPPMVALPNGGKM
jgi:hypothetical protein